MTDSKINLHLDVLPFLNLPLYLNNIPFIRELFIENEGIDELFELELRIKADQPCIYPSSFKLVSIKPGNEVNIPLDILKVDRQYFSQLSEPDKILLTFELIVKGEVLQSKEHTLTAYPIEFFGGFHILPELIASYITPNHPYIYHIKRNAAEILERNGQKPAFEGYQSDDPERVLQLMSALYTAVHGEQIIYSSLPPGYEESGQRLRLLNTIQQERFGNCIDLSLLYAACLEAIDLHPILIIVRGHAFVGCWLQDDKFSEIVNDDKTSITKRLSKGIREIAVLESTTLCKGNPPNFFNALHSGEAQLIEKEEFLLSIDIKRARTARIRPLPIIREFSSEPLKDFQNLESLSGEMEKNFEIGAIYSDELLQGGKQTTKQKIWERKLLDLSLRNSLLNLRMTRNMLQLVDIDMSHLEDTLSEGKTFSILPSSGTVVQRQYNIYMPPIHHSSPLYELANDELKYNRLLTHYHERDLDNILSYINKNAKQAIEENGSSTLYLAIGLLKWYDRKSPDQPRLSPILLLPVELNRRSVNSKFTLKSREEETMINITLIEFLRQEYDLNLGMLEQLPTDDKGVDVAKVMGMVRRAVMQLKGWDVEEQLVLGNFSFSKLILWKDIVVYHEEILKSPMVRSLVEGKLAMQIDHDNDTDEMDDLLPAEMALPIPTDVSQMKAVFAAQKGKSFVLHGPPGTGKSQTITNIIADALFNGKRVLFVAAKKAALDVVHKRLEQIGLSPFTLELHSNKSKKSDVLAQLEKSLDSGRKSRSFDFGQEADRLFKSRQEISGYVKELHKIRPLGWSLFDSISALEYLGSLDLSLVQIPDTVFDRLSMDMYQDWQDWLLEYKAIYPLISSPLTNPLKCLSHTSYSSRMESQIFHQTGELISQLETVKQLSTELLNRLFLEEISLSEEQFEVVFQLADALPKSPDFPVLLGCFIAERDNQVLFEDWLNYFEKYKDCSGQLLGQYNSQILNEDFSLWQLEWNKANQNWFLPKWLGKKKVKKHFGAYRKSKFSSDEQVIQLFQLADELLKYKKVLGQTRFDAVKNALQSWYKEEDTDLEYLHKIHEHLKWMESRVRVFGIQSYKKWMEALQQHGIRQSGEFFRSEKIQLDQFCNQVQKLRGLIEEYVQLTGFSLEGAGTENGYFDHFLSRLKGIEKHLPEFKNWINYVAIKSKGKQLGLSWFIDAAEERNTSDEIEEVFLHAIHVGFAERVIESSDVLSLFDGKLFSAKIEQYKKIARNFQELTKQELYMRLSGRLPYAPAEAMQSSEIGLLQRAIKNRGRGISIRKLFDQIPMLLPRLAPCMLMSPISVAQYFDVNTDHFDLVIFDEASQLPTCEAISALARAKQAVIVGDPKQMPPTSFFSSIKLDEENMEIEDLESILDDCLALSVPSKYLLRHYRSKHESLIAFSNVNYYENKLLTFPSADDLSKKVIHHPVTGFYDKGKTRQNKFEAQAIILFVKNHYKDPARKNISLGVVTFSQTQQALIEEMLQELFLKYPEIEQSSIECPEPIFVKNLENVQGDERDIILFSIGYGPDQENKLSMNFGPLNRNGGWRRLNVAVTRARSEMHVFATLTSDQIDLSRTTAEGVSGLKSFLHFAEKGNLVMKADTQPSKPIGESLSNSISKRLKAAGLEVRTDIGTSGFKVDLGVVNPGKPSEYLLGILIDGKYYWEAKTTNDREMVMPAVLKALGWNIFRIWAMDWKTDSDAIISEILERVEQLKSGSIELLEDQKTHEESGEENDISHVLEEDQESRITSYRRAYIATALLAVKGGSAETIYDYYSRGKLKEQLGEVIRQEAPIGKKLLSKRILATWNISKLSAKLDTYLDDILTEMGAKHVLHHQRFYVGIGEGEPLGKINFYRTNEIEKREIEDIALEELAIAILETLHQNFSIDEAELLRYVAKIFGFSKVGRQIDESLRYTLDMLESRGRLRREDGRVKVG